MQASRGLGRVLQRAPRALFWLALSGLWRTSPGIRNRGQKWLIRGFYQLLSALDRKADVTVMNYGYSALGSDAPALELSADEAASRYSLQLYYRVAGAVDLHGKDVLEVGCGRGGGSAYLKRVFQPRSLVGLDFAERAIAFCRQRYRQDGLTFQPGDAEHLPFPPERFDVVVNVESSHCYPSVPRFLSEVARVLRPGGYLLLADFRSPGHLELFRQDLRASGLLQVEEERITPNVVRALELDSERRGRLIESRIPGFLRASLLQFAAVKDSRLYERFRSGELEYWRIVVQKAERDTVPPVGSSAE